MTRTTLFRSNRTQAVRLPKAVALPDDVHEVDIVAMGDIRIIVPAHDNWDAWFESGIRPTDDYMAS